MKVFKLNEPYKTKALNSLEKDNLTFSGQSLVGFSNETVYNFAKATGLRSKKQRHIIKRFRKIMIQAIENGLRRAIDENENKI